MSPPSDPEVSAIKEYQAAQRGQLTGPLAPPPASVVPSSLQPADVAAGAALGAKAGLALPGIVRTAAEVGAIGPAQAAARPLTERVPEHVGFLDLQIPTRLMAEQAVGLLPGAASELVASRMGRSVMAPPIEPAPPPAGPKVATSPVTGKPVYRYDRATGTTKPVYEHELAKPITPPEPGPNGTLTTDGPPSLVDGKTPFDPSVPPEMPRESTFWHRLWSMWQRNVIEKFPREAAIARRIPQSPVVSVTEQFHAGLADDLANLSKETTYRAIPAEDWVNAEARAVAKLDAGASEAEAMAEFPAPVQQYIRARQGRMVEEQGARELLGLPELPEAPFPYLPRRTSNVGKDAVRVFRRGGYGQDIRTSLGSFARERAYRTTRDGMANGIEYEDPRISAMMREWAGLRLRRTADFVRSLEGRTLFRTAEEARAASARRQAVPIEDFVPGGRRWWAPSRAEAVFIKHQFQSRESTLGSLVHYSNSLFRNPNLFNPIPHFTKNMGAKYALAGGNPAKLAGDIVEFTRGSNPELLARFDAVMPYAKTGLTAHELLSDELAKLSPSALQRATYKVGRWLTKPNTLSSKALFKWGDPAMRYSLWKQHIGRGMTDQEAANHAWVDLIRYSTRSEVVDFWKSLPTNFFVPWRWGTVTSLLKQSGLRPVRTALLLGAIDYAREARYRQSGRWTHLPWDYVYGPVAEMLEHPKTASYILPTTMLFGPGGAFAASQLRSLLADTTGRGEWGRLRNMFWGISQIFELPKEWQAYERTGDTRHIVNMLTTAMLGEHNAAKYEPVRLSRRLPTSLPGMQWNPDVAASLPIPTLNTNVSNEVRRLGIDPHFRSTVQAAGRTVDLPPDVADKFAQIRGKVATQSIEQLLGSPRYREFDTKTQKKIITTQFAKARRAAIAQLRPEISQALRADSLKREPEPKLGPPPIP